jgi:NADPH2:quinone reductase
LLPLLTGKGRAHHGEILREATKLAEAGKLTPRLSTERFSFETALQAHMAVESAKTVGKVVVEVQDP